MPVSDASASPLGDRVKGLEGCMGVTEVHVGGGRVYASLWDGSLAVCDARCLAKSVTKHVSPRLGCCTWRGSSEEVASICADGTVWCHDVISSEGSLLGSHDAGARCVRFSHSRNVLVTGGWDAKIMTWDVRSSGKKEALHEVRTGNKVYAMDLQNDVLVVGCAGRVVSVHDLRKLQEPMQKRESSLRSQTRSLSVSPDASSFVMAAMDGRVAVEFIDPSEEAQSKKFAFKCHRVPSAEGCLVYPVQAVAHHPCYHSTFATAGGDGCVAIWDGSQRKKLFQTDRHNVGVSSIAFNEQGTILAVGTSRTGALEHSQQEGEGVFIRQIDDVHVRPKSHARPVAQA